MMRKIKMESPKEMGMEIGKPMPHYPSVYFDAYTLPEAKDWKIGKTYQIGLQIVMRGQSMRKGSDGKEHGNFDFDIVAIDPGKEITAKNQRYTDSADSEDKKS